MNSRSNQTIHRERGKALGLLELIAIALGGMVGGGIFTILRISLSIIGAYPPFAIGLGGVTAALAAYSYIKLGVYFKDQGATYSFIKKVFPNSHFAASVIGWWITFGYISTMALYAHTFSSYAISDTSFSESVWMRKLVAEGIIALFAIINILSVKGMGKIEDLMVYTKLTILVVISIVLITSSNTSYPTLLQEHEGGVPFWGILIVSSLTFVAYEGFQLVIMAVDEMDNPDRNIPYAIYSAIAIAIALYIILAVGALLSIPLQTIIDNKEYALASGAQDVLGFLGKDLIILGALLATSSAISGTVFGSSRLMAVIAKDGYFPAILSKRSGQIPIYGILAISVLAGILILIGGLRLIMEFGSITFLLVSLLTAYANHRIREKTKSHRFVSTSAIVLLFSASLLILYYEYHHDFAQVLFIVSMYLLLTLGAWGFSYRKNS